MSFPASARSLQRIGFFARTKRRCDIRGVRLLRVNTGLAVTGPGSIHIRGFTFRVTVEH